MIMVHTGERVLSIPARELLIWVCAQAKRKAGKNMPIKPDISNLKESPGFSSLSRGMAMGNRNKAAAVTRSAPTSSGSNALRPCLIRIKDVPQIRDKTINRKTAV